MSDAMAAIRKAGEFKPLGTVVQIDHSVVDYLAEMILVAAMQVTDADGNVIMVRTDNASTRACHPCDQDRHRRA